MLDERTIDVGDNEEQETTIDLDAPTPEQPLEEDIIDVEQVSEDSNESNNAPAKSGEQSNVQADKEELGEYSEGVKKRIAKLTRKMREAERQKDEAINYAKTIKESTETLRNKYERLDANYTQEFEKRVTTNLDATKQKLAIAINSGDVEGQVAAQTELAQLTMDATRLARIKDIEKPVEKPALAAETIEAPRKQVDPQADAWASKNSWFGTDNAMTYTAFDIHKNLVEEEGYDPNTTEYYSEVDKRIRVAFPNKFDRVEGTTNEPVQNVASARRPATKGRRKTVKLTPSQVAISKKLGVPLEEYAKQLSLKEE